MRLSAIQVVASLLALSQAAPAEVASIEAATLEVAAPETSPVELSPLVKRDNKCLDSSFINQTTGGSPRVSDCQQLARNIAGGGTWTHGAGGEHRQLAQYGTCAFGVEGDKSVNIAYIGNEDIMDLIRDSINRFQWNGLVGAMGSMRCWSAQGHVQYATMIWGIYHT